MADMQSYLEGQVAGLTDVQLGNTGLQVSNKTGVSTANGKTLPSDSELWNTLDPETDKRFIIPFVSPSDANYREVYIQLMLKRYLDQGAFNRMVLMRDSK